MSLINQMLQDLEKRQPGGDSRPLAAVRAVPRPRRLKLFWPLMLVLAVAAAVLSWQLWQASSPRPAAPLPAITAAPAATSAVASPDAHESAADVVPAPLQTAAAPPPAPPTASAPIEPALKESVELSRLPKDAPAAKPVAAQTVPAPAAATAPSTVAKQFRELTPQQRAESEYRKALALVQQGRVSEAVDSLNQTLQMDAQHGAARQALIGLLVESRRFVEAERRLQEGLNQDRAQPELAMTLARLQVERGDAGAAIATLERSQSAAADRADYHGFMAALLQRDGRHAEAIEHYRLALRRTPSAIWQMGLGISLQAENRAQEAREAFSRARAANTLSPELQAFVEQRLRQLGQ